MAYVINRAANSTHQEGRTRFALLFFLLLVNVMASATDAVSFDREAALDQSQAVVGQIIGDYVLTTIDGDDVRLTDYRGKPLLVSMIFTSCHHICPTTTKNLAIAVATAEETLGRGTFDVVTIGFDTANDSPEAMRSFARKLGIDKSNWHFLSASPATIAALSADLGFQFLPSPRGFDHLNQTTMVDRDGVVYAQVYGMRFELPWLMEPLKQLVLNRPESVGRPLARLLDRVRLFCTVYNPATGRYEFDYSLFFRIAAGLIVITSIALFLWREARRSRAR